MAWCLHHLGLEATSSLSYVLDKIAHTVPSSPFYFFLLNYGNDTTPDIALSFRLDFGIGVHVASKTEGSVN